MRESEKAGGWREIQFADGSLARFRPSELRRLSPYPNELYGDKSTSNLTFPNLQKKAKYDRKTNDHEISLDNNQDNNSDFKKRITSFVAATDGYSSANDSTFGVNSKATNYVSFSNASPLTLGTKLVVIKTGVVGKVISEKLGGWRTLLFEDGSTSSYRPSDLAIPKSELQSNEFRYSSSSDTSSNVSSSSCSVSRGDSPVNDVCN